MLLDVVDLLVSLGNSVFKDLELCRVQVTSLAVRAFQVFHVQDGIDSVKFVHEGCFLIMGIVRVCFGNLCFFGHDIFDPGHDFVHDGVNIQVR